MLQLIKKISNWYSLPIAEGKRVVEDALIDYRAVQQRLDEYTKEGRSYKYIVDDLDGFNVEETEFEIEYNDLQLVIKKTGDTYVIDNPVCISLPNNECLEPVELDFESYLAQNSTK